MKRVDEYIKALELSGRSKDTCDWHRKFVLVFCQNFEEVTDENIEAAVKIANKELIYRKGQARPKGVLTIFKKWCEKGTIVRDRKIPGLYRPHNCSRVCRHNYNNHCTYNRDEFLSGVIGGKKCHCFEKPEIIESNQIDSKKPFDWVFSKRCDYKDSHSVRWIE